MSIYEGSLVEDGGGQGEGEKESKGGLGELFGKLRKFKVLNKMFFDYSFYHV